MRAVLVLLLAVACAAAPGVESPADGGLDGDPPIDAGSDGGSMPADGGEPACTFGADQTCNDSPAVSALWGSCRADGTCACQTGFEVNPATGRCRPQGSFTCGDMTCGPDEFCTERVHARDGGGFSTWQCGLFWQCSTTDCACAIQSFVSASCVNPTCQAETPHVLLRCDDLN